MRCKRNALLEINHSLAQRSYVDWKYHHLSELVSTAPKPRASNGQRVAYRFTTRSLPELTPFYHSFYHGHRKGVPEIEIPPLALAVWFMDDGCRSRSSAYFNTQQFSVEEQLRLLDLLWRQHHLEATLNKDKSYRRIRIRAGSISRFKELVGAYILPEFQYKLP